MFQGDNWCRLKWSKKMSTGIKHIFWVIKTAHEKDNQKHLDSTPNYLLTKILSRTFKKSIYASWYTDKISARIEIYLYVQYNLIQPKH
jgi:hypothetical protein